MSSHTPWKVFDENGKHIASCCNATIAACLLSFIGNAKWSIVFRTTGAGTIMVWNDGDIEAEAVDKAAVTMYRRNEAGQAEFKANSAKRFAAFQEEQRQRNVSIGIEDIRRKVPGFFEKGGDK